MLLNLILRVLNSVATEHSHILNMYCVPDYYVKNHSSPKVLKDFTLTFLSIVKIFDFKVSNVYTTSINPTTLIKLLRVKSSPGHLLTPLTCHTTYLPEPSIPLTLHNTKNRWTKLPLHCNSGSTISVQCHFLPTMANGSSGVIDLPDFTFSNDSMT